ncbi:heat shock protein [Opitutaceae bacterium TAV1]|nr:heat shock protein [Opitutaceae bacterium TAV1]
MKSLLPLFLAVLLAGCASRTTGLPAPDSPVGYGWTLASIGGDPVTLPADNARPLRLQFGADGLSATGYSGLNGFLGRTNFDGNKLKFGPLAMTRRGGPAELMQLENRYTAALTSVTAWAIRDRQLVLSAGDTPVLVFEMEPPRVQQ